MISKHRLTIILLAIVLIGFFLRFYHLDTNPPSLTWDEAAWGYNAYTLGIDGKDEFGKFLPITYLESFGDFKPPLYAYLSILPIKIFGLNEFSTRFASAFFGTLTVLLTYFLIKQLFTKWEVRSKLAFLTSFLLAISPWHILLSRAAFEANVASFFIVAGVLLFFLAIQKKPWLILLSFLSFVLSMYTFNTARIVSPLLVGGLLLFHWKSVFAMKKEVFIAAAISFFIFLPLLLFLKTPQAQLRFAEVNIFSDSSVIKRVNQEVENSGSSALAKIIYNRRFAYSVEYLKHYFDNLSPLFLFIRGDGNPKFSIQDVGELYIWELPFLIGGIFLLAKNNKRIFGFLLFWLLLGIIPAATARETPHALRIETTLPTFQIFTAFGLFFFIEKVSSIKYQVLSTKIKYFIFLSSFFIFAFSFLYFLHNYFIHYPREFSGEWQYGYKDAISFMQANNNRFDKVYFTESLGRPYIYFLYYIQYDPNKFRNSAKVEREALGFVHVKHFDKYYFSKDMGNSKKESKVLYVDTPGNIPSGAQILKKFPLLNGDTTLIAYTL